VALGADGAPCNNRLDAFTEMRLAALLQKPRLGPRAMPAATVLGLATRGGARALGLDAEVGRLEVGRRADVVVVRRRRLHASPRLGGDPVADLVYAHTAADVGWVLVDGRVVVEDGRLVTLDEPAVLAEAERQREALLARAGPLG
jgi:cytosine/adenosine deaminase-related metal-dependent hydrolase